MPIFCTVRLTLFKYPQCFQHDHLRYQLGGGRSRLPLSDQKGWGEVPTCGCSLAGHCLGRGGVGGGAHSDEMLLDSGAIAQQRQPLRADWPLGSVRRPIEKHGWANWYCMATVSPVGRAQKRDTDSEGKRGARAAESVPREPYCPACGRERSMHTHQVAVFIAGGFKGAEAQVKWLGQPGGGGEDRMASLGVAREGKWEGGHGLRRRSPGGGGVGRRGS